MNNGKIQFSRVGSSKIEFETPFTYACGTITRAKLQAAGNKSFDNDNFALGTLAGFYLAEVMGHKLVDLPSWKKITPDDVYKASLIWDNQIVEAEDTDEDEGEVEDENPLAMTGERS